MKYMAHRKQVLCLRFLRVYLLLLLLQIFFVFYLCNTSLHCADERDLPVGASNTPDCTVFGVHSLGLTIPVRNGRIVFAHSPSCT